MMEKRFPHVVECFADNGCHSHWAVIDGNTGETIIEDIDNYAALSAVSKRIMAAAEQYEQEVHMRLYHKTDNMKDVLKTGKSLGEALADAAEFFIMHNA